jgi:hypothetical protein
LNFDEKLVGDVLVHSGYRGAENVPSNKINLYDHFTPTAVVEKEGETFVLRENHVTVLQNAFYRGNDFVAREEEEEDTNENDFDFGFD